MKTIEEKELLKVSISRELSHFRGLLLQVNKSMQAIQEAGDQETIRQAMRDHVDIDLRILRGIARRLEKFLAFPVKVDRRERHPDSEKEKEKFSHYRGDGWTIRDIAKKTRMSLYTVNQKLKRYKIN